MNLLYLFGTKNCHKNIKNPLFFQFIKKGDKMDYTNYTGISLLSPSYVILSNILLSRMTPYANEIIGECQCEFRMNKWTIHRVYSIRQILEKKRKYYKEVCQFFIDSEKAYNCLNNKNDVCLRPHGRCENILKKCSYKTLHYQQLNSSSLLQSTILEILQA